jgi:hypothetical protein
MIRSTRTAVRSLGLSGTLAYGFLNTFYYTVGIIITWVFISKVFYLSRGVVLFSFTHLRFLRV